MTRRSALLITSFAVPAWSFQGGKGRKSPHETVAVELGDSKISISYGRPYLKGRNMAKLTPDGEVWRLGADEATKLTTNVPVRIGSTVTVPAGSASLFAITGPEKWTMIVNKVADQWGAFSYEQSQDIGRFDVPVEKLSTPVEQFTITLAKQGSKEAQLSMAWGSQRVSTTIAVGQT